MKKVIRFCLVVGTFLLPALGFSQGIESGDSMVSLYGGVGSALQKSGVEIDGSKLSWGNVGAEFGLSYQYFPSPYLGLGADVHYAGFKGSKSHEEVAGWYHWHTFESDFSMDTFHVMATGRLNINPQSPVRLYIPFGAGVVWAVGNMEYKWDDEHLDSRRDYDTSFSWYAGVGLEFEQSQNLAWGLEARYNCFEYDYGGLVDDIGGRLTKSGTEHSYVSLLLTVRFK